MSEDLCKANILLVDDTDGNLTVLEAILQPLQQNLIKASSGREALKHLLSHDFALILLDVQMPDMDGFETAEMIKRRERTRHVPIIFITAINKEERYVFQGYDAGAVDYLYKPFEPDILRSKVKVFVELYEQAQEIKRQAELLRESDQREAERKQLIAVSEASARQFRFLIDVLASVTEGRLHLCESKKSLPRAAIPFGEPIPLTPVTGLAALRRCMRDAAKHAGYEDDRCQDLVTASSEAAMNAIVHAGGGRARVCVDDGDKIQVWIDDRGKGIALDQLPRATLDRGYSTKDTLGHGFWLMLRTADRAYVLTSQSGTTVVIEQDKTVPPPPWQGDRKSMFG